MHLKEFRDAKAIFNEEKEKLISEGVKVADNIEVGMMVEIPAAAVNADNFAKEAPTDKSSRHGCFMIS